MIQHFEPISLKKMDSVRLMDRVDIKYILSINQLEEILHAVAQSYHIMEELQTRQFLYKNIYFDTADRQMFLSHHNGKALRYKLRIREYSEFHRIYLEIKKKHKGRTIKSRILLSEEGSIDQYTKLTQLPSNVKTFLKQELPYPINQLVKSMKNEFIRLTLVHKDMEERITIDTNLLFLSRDKRQEIHLGRKVLPGIAVAEIKKNGHSGTHHFQNELKRRGIRPDRMSKYCIGSISLFPDLKYNNFKNINLAIERMSNVSV
ncbi:MAG: polyphosphate polymerase domain-containing protein [Spirochaetales bacterium]|nr:polyphosphate polymerase domain-containing protein [Spirochaetales bacterium]